MMCGSLIAQATYLSRCPTSGNGVPRRGDPWRHPWYREICYENKFKQIDTESAKTCFKLSSFVLMSVFKLGRSVLSSVFFHHLLWKRNLRDTDVLPVTLSTASKHRTSHTQDLIYCLTPTGSKLIPLCQLTIPSAINASNYYRLKLVSCLAESINRLVFNSIYLELLSLSQQSTSALNTTQQNTTPQQTIS